MEILKTEQARYKSGKTYTRAYVRCECGNEYWINSYKPQGKLCRLCSNRKNGVAKRGKPSWNSGKAFEPKQIGSTYIDSDGYMQVWIGKNTLSSKKGGYYLVHRMIAEIVLGRELLPNELVHHIDGNKQNNNSSNLYVTTNAHTHRLIHAQLESIAFELVRAGIIVFQDNEYKIAPYISNGISADGEFSERLNVLAHGNTEPSKAISFEGATTIQQWSRIKRSEAPSIPNEG